MMEALSQNYPFGDYFTHASVVEAADISTLTLTRWTDRGVLSICPEQKGGTGNRRYWSLFDIVALRVVSELSAYGVPPSVGNHLIESDRFRKELIGMMDLTSSSDGDASIADVKILFWSKDGRFEAECVAGKNWPHLPSDRTVQAFFTINLSSIYSAVSSRCQELR